MISWSISAPCHGHDTFFRIQRRQLMFALVSLFFFWGSLSLQINFVVATFYLFLWFGWFCLQTKWFFYICCIFLLSGCLCNFLYVKKKFNKEKRVVSDLHRGGGSRKELLSTPFFPSICLSLFFNSNFERE